MLPQAITCNEVPIITYFLTNDGQGGPTFLGNVTSICMIKISFLNLNEQSS